MSHRNSYGTKPSVSVPADILIMTEDTGYPRNTNDMDTLLAMLASEDMLDALDVCKEDFPMTAYGMLQDTTEGWKAMYAWMTTYAEGSSVERWAALSVAASYAKRITFQMQGEALAPEPELSVQEIVSKFAMGEDAESGLRDGLYILSTTGDPDENLSLDWLWYATPNCSPMRYRGALFAMVLVIGAKVRELADFSKSNPAELWGGLYVVI